MAAMAPVLGALSTVTAAEPNKAAEALPFDFAYLNLCFFSTEEWFEKHFAGIARSFKESYNPEPYNLKLDLSAPMAWVAVDLLSNEVRKLGLPYGFLPREFKIVKTTPIFSYSDKDASDVKIYGRTEIRYDIEGIIAYKFFDKMKALLDRPASLEEPAIHSCQLSQVTLQTSRDLYYKFKREWI